MTDPQALKMGKLDGKELAQVVERSLNTFAHTEQVDQFVKEMSNSHRTLQQIFTSLCAAWLAHLSETEHYDLRNEGSVEFAKSIKEQLVASHFPFV